MQLIAKVVEEGEQLMRWIARIVEVMELISGRIVEVDNSWNRLQGLWK
jgi:hypothetical protein